MNRTVSRLLWVWGPALALMALIFALSSLPELPPVPGGLPDVGAHGLVYALLGALVVRALAGGVWEDVTLTRVGAAWLIATVYGATDEFHQRFVPGRTPELRDLSADALGALIGALFVWGCVIVFSTYGQRHRH